MDLSLYTAKKAVLTPRTAYMRHKERNFDELARRMFELHYYRRPVYNFAGATMANREILTDVEIDADSVVLDVGAFVGDWSEKISDRFDPTIYAFEPAASGVKAMHKKLGDRPKVHIFDYGLGGADQTAKLALAGPGSSIYTDESPFGLVDIEIRDIAAVLGELAIDEVDLLKVNIEGGEFDLFDRLIETDWLPRVRLVLIQFHEWHPKAYRRRRSIRRELRRTHEEVWDYSWVWEYWRRVET